MSYVYFIRPVDMQGPVKIGCSKYPKERLRDLTLWSPYPLEIAASMKGDVELEQRFHALFVADHSHHEWFNWTPDLEAVIQSVAAGAFDINALPAPKNITARVVRRVFSDEARKLASYRMRANWTCKKTGYSSPVKMYAGGFDGTDEQIRSVEAYLEAPHINGRPFGVGYPHWDAVRKSYHAKLQEQVA